MNTRYMLDLTGAKLPDWWPEWSQKVIPLRKGRYWKEFDVIEDEMPPGWKGKMWLHYKRVGRARPSDSMVYPIGVDRYRLPEGAVIIEVKQ